MAKKVPFKNIQEMLSFLRKIRKEREAYSKTLIKQLKKEEKFWGEYERAYDSGLERETFGTRRKHGRKTTEGQKSMSMAEGQSNGKMGPPAHSKMRKYKLVTSKSTLIAESAIKYKSKKK